MPKVHTTFWPDKELDVSEEEELDLQRQGLIAKGKRTHKTTKSEKEND